MQKKTIKIIYWVLTILFAAFMLFSAITELFPNQTAKDFIVSLGYPLYLNTILGVAKVLGIVAILQTKFKTIKEWAYAGFVIDILGATSSFILLSNSLMPIIQMSPFIIAVFASYFLWKKTY